MTGWTGGQYSLWRLLLALCLLAEAVGSAFGVESGYEGVLLGVLVIGSVLVGFGVIPWVAALVAGAPLLLSPDFIDSNDFCLVAALLLHGISPAAPFGSLAARGRPDPRGDWRLPVAWGVTAWLLVLAAWTWIAIWLLGDGERIRMQDGFVMLHLAAINPGWIRPKRGAEGSLFYDGTCGVCHSTVRFVLAEDRAARFRPSPLFGPTFESKVPVATREDLPDSFVVVDPKGTVRFESDSVLFVAAGLGGWWRLLGALGMAFPKGFRDAVYRFIARNRYRVAGKVDAPCPIVPRDLTERFDP